MGGGRGWRARAIDDASLFGEHDGVQTQRGEAVGRPDGLGLTQASLAESSHRAPDQVGLVVFSTPKGGRVGAGTGRGSQHQTRRIEQMRGGGLLGADRAQLGAFDPASGLRCKDGQGLVFFVDHRDQGDGRDVESFPKGAGSVLAANLHRPVADELEGGGGQAGSWSRSGDGDQGDPSDETGEGEASGRPARHGAEDALPEGLTPSGKWQGG